MFSFLKLLFQCKSFPNIRKLQLDHCSVSLMKNIQQILNTFPRLQSLSIGKVNDFQLFGDILKKFLFVSLDKQVLIHLCISGFYFDEIYPEYLDEEQFKRNLEEIFIPLRIRKNCYNISFNRHNQFLDIWF
jgi:hypothetical protein